MSSFHYYVQEHVKTVQLHQEVTRKQSNIKACSQWKFILGHGWIKHKQNLFFWSWCVQIIVTLLHVASHIAIHQIKNITAEGSNHNHSLCLSMTHPQWNRAPWLWVQLQVHVIFWEMCECQRDEWNADDAAAWDRLHPSLTLGSFAILNPFFITFPSLFLLTRAVRGDINLSDRLCDPPLGLGGRRSAVNINILPGFVAGARHRAASSTITSGETGVQERSEYCHIFSLQKNNKYLKRWFHPYFDLNHLNRS